MRVKIRWVAILCFMFGLLSGYGSILHSETPPLRSPKEKAPPAVSAYGKTFLPQASPRTIDRDYILGPEDVIEIVVWDNEDLSREVHISREGKFSYPLIGKVSAGGLTATQLEEHIAERLADGYLVDPQVSISIVEYKSKKVFVLGEIGGPQGKGGGPNNYPLTGKTTLLEIISLAGGPTPDAGHEVILVRPRSGERKKNPTVLEEASGEELIIINLKKLLEGTGNFSENIVLQSGDTIYIPRAHFFYVFGEVESPGKFVLERDTTVLKAITLAGGFTDKAARKKIKIIRKKAGPNEIPIKLDAFVEPEDVIKIPESFF